VCAVVEAIGAEAKKKVMDWYMQLQLKDYKYIFHPANTEV
jgi:hypothetical protein